MVLYPNKLPESERVCSGICRGKVLYKESDIERMLQNGYKEAWQARQMP